MRKILLLLTGLCAFWIINAQSRLNVKALRNLRPQRCVSTKVNKAITSNTKNAAYLQDFEGDFPGDMIILDLDGLTPNGEAGAPGEWGIVARFDDETNHAAAVTSYYDDGDKTSNDWMITSKITVPASGEINLIWEASSWSSVYPETYEVLISETQPDAANFDNTKFTKVAEITETVGYTYNALDLSNYYGKDIWVAYRNISNWMWSIGIDNIQVNDFTGLDLAFTSVSYQKKVALEQGQTITGNVTSMRSTKVTSFDVNWKVGDGATNTYSVSEVEIDMMANHKFEHDIQYTPSAIGTETITIWISNVNGTSNDAIADNNEMSMDVEVIEGSYYQDFESSFPGVYTYDIDEQPIGDYPPASWSFTSILGTILAYSPAVDGTDDWIVFPKISIDEGEFLSWKHSAHSDSNPQKYEIYVADTFDPENFNASTFTLIETIDGVDNTSLESFAIPLDKYAGESKYFAFRNVTDIAGGYTFIDDIHVFAPTTDSDAELVKIIGLQEYYSLNDEINVKGIFKNLSASDVTSYEISYQYGDAAVVSQIFDASTITFLQSEEFVFDQKIAADAHGIFTFKVWISKVNSAVDSNTDNNELTLDIEIISDPQEKIVLIEEFTGAWCGACPRGGLILNNLIEKYNGKVIGIAHHINDSMAISDADQILNAYARLA